MPITLYRGDVVFTADAHGTIMHTVISTAQRLGAPLSDGRASSVHVAIATGNNLEVVEAVGAGLKRRPIHDGRYRVYHYVGEKGPLVRDCAAQVAESHFDQQSPDTNFRAIQQGPRSVESIPFEVESAECQYPAVRSGRSLLVELLLFEFCVEMLHGSRRGCAPGATAR